MANETPQTTEKKQDYIIDIVSDDKGKIQMANGVLAAIIQKNVLEIDGVMRLAPQGIVDGLASIFSRKGYESNIAIESSDKGAIITLALNLKTGCVIPQVAAAVRDRLFDVIPRLTGYAVSKVNLTIAAIEDELPPEEAAPQVPVQSI